MHRTTTALGVLIAAVISLFATSANSQTPSQTPPAVESWDQPEEPVRILGPIYFVGTKGLGVYLFTTSEGHILMNTGMPSSGPMIEESIRKLGFKPDDIKLMINSHAHIDHAGAFAYLKEKYGAQMAVMREDVAAMESGDKVDFEYGDELHLPAGEGRSDSTRWGHNQDRRRAAHRLSHTWPHARLDDLDCEPRGRRQDLRRGLSRWGRFQFRVTGW